MALNEQAAAASKAAKPKRTRKSKAVADANAALVLEDGEHGDDPDERQAMERGIAASEAVTGED